ncbi:MAG: hypothetical protein GY811_19945 [Myxococcales bacterium]|nr:hypothetical protein [Myxococcales bacterium]
MRLEIANVVRALRNALAVDEFIVSESRGQIASESLGAAASRSEARPYRIEAQIYVDRQKGRGLAGLAPLASRDLEAQIKDASTRAYGALGASWQLPLPAAPARVPVFEATTSKAAREMANHVLGEVDRLTSGTRHLIEAKATVRHDTHRAVLSNGFDNRYQSSNISVEAIVEADGGHPVPLHVRARRLTDLDLVLEAAMERAMGRSLRDAHATLAAPSHVDLVLEHSTYLPREASDFGIWTALVHQASAAKVRSGLSTHTPGQPLIPTPLRGEALSLRSEGTKAYALRSAPFSLDGQATRNFTIASEGLAVGVSVDHMNEAMGAGVANGGVRRLVVAGGASSASELGRPHTRPVLLVHNLGVVSTTPRGSLYLEVASATLRTRDSLGRVAETPVRSAVICAKLGDWLEEAYFSRETHDESWLLGPQAMRINNVRIH